MTKSTCRNKLFYLARTDYMGLRVAITVIAMILCILRIVFPDWKIDHITIGLGILALLPWMAYFISSAKFPGGYEIRFRDLEAAVSELEVPATQKESDESTQNLEQIFQQDASLALVALRIEIEKRLRKIAEIYNISERLPLIRLVRELSNKIELSVGGLQEIIMAGNRAAHGASVEPSVADWAYQEGPVILRGLDEFVKEKKVTKEEVSQ